MCLFSLALLFSSTWKYLRIFFSARALNKENAKLIRRFWVAKFRCVLQKSWAPATIFRILKIHTRREIALHFYYTHTHTFTCDFSCCSHLERASRSHNSHFFGRSVCFMFVLVFVQIRKKKPFGYFVDCVKNANQSNGNFGSFHFVWSCKHDKNTSYRICCCFFVALLNVSIMSCHLL